MSIQGNVYQRIMDDVIDNCATTFEEDGVNQQTLDDLRKVCLALLMCRPTGPTQHHNLPSYFSY